MPEEEAKAPSNDASDLEQIRQILIGSFSHEVNERFQQIAQDLEHLDERVSKRFEATSERIQQEVKSLHASITACRKDGETKRGELQQRISTTKTELNQQLDALSHTLAATEKSVRHDMEHGLGELRNEIRQQLDDINRRMHEGFSKLGETSITRTTFRDALQQLSSQFEAEDG